MPDMRDPRSTLYSQWVAVVQNASFTSYFPVAFFLVLFATGGLIPFLLSIAVALALSAACQHFLNPLQPIPNGAVLITGASSGLGRDMALRLSALGVTVFATVRKEEDGQTLQADAGSSANLVPVTLDVNSVEDIAAAVRTVEAALSERGLRLLAVVNNAGYGAKSPLELMTTHRLREQFETNVFAVVAVTNAFLPLLRDAASRSGSHASILMISSVAGQVTLPGSGSYSASKHAMEALAAAYRMELRSFNIRVTLIEPGFFPTQFAERSLSHAQEMFTAAEESRIGPQVMAVYRRGWATSQKRIAQPLGWVTDTVVRAIFARRAVSRLVCGWEGFIMGGVRLLPDALLDAVLGRPWK
jgi:NAD(P)-dependent dehydrogenase (short-subunit alcohol dehydrogenase family)